MDRMRPVRAGWSAMSWSESCPEGCCPPTVIRGGVGRVVYGGPGSGRRPSPGSRDRWTGRDWSPSRAAQRIGKSAGARYETYVAAFSSPVGSVSGSGPRRRAERLAWSMFTQYSMGRSFHRRNCKSCGGTGLWTCEPFGTREITSPRARLGWLTTSERAR